MKTTRTQLVTAPTGQIISLNEAKAHLRVDHTSDDGYIQALIFGAINRVEEILHRKLITQTWKAFYDSWDEFVLPFGKLQSVTHVKYTDSDNTQSTWAATEYIVDTVSDPGKIRIGYSKTYPGDTLYPSNPIEIQFVCGYGAHELKTITGATNATPIAITCATHGYVTGNKVLISSVGGNTNANGTWQITKTGDNTFTLDSSTGNAAYTSGGQVVKIDIPIDIKIAILLIVANQYDQRSEFSDIKIIPDYVMSLLYPYRLFNYESE